MTSEAHSISIGPSKSGATPVLRAVTWALFAVVAILILPSILAYWVTLPWGGNIGFILGFTVFSLCHCGATLGRRRLVLFFLLTVVISFIDEDVGVRTGLVFGPYHYSDMLGVKLDHVPVLIPLGWFMMIYASWVVAQALLRGADLRRPGSAVVLALFAALVMTGWDMVMDPPVSSHGNWVWEQGGPYFGVPLHNYFGWVMNAFLIYVAFYFADRASTMRPAGYAFGDTFAALPVILYAIFSLEYVVPGRQPPLILIGVFSMFMPAILALARLALPQAREAHEARATGCPG